MTSSDTDTSTKEDRIEETVRMIRQFEGTVEDPDQWRVEIPVNIFDAVSARLATESNPGDKLGTYYQGISLVYSEVVQEPRVRYRSPLKQHTEKMDLQTDDDA